MKQPRFNPEFLTPGRQALCPVGNGDEVVAPAVAGLFRVSRPFAICRPAVGKALLAVTAGVMTVVVLTVYAVLPGRALAHVSDEGLYGVAPARADADSTVAVIAEHGVGRVATATNYPFPDLVKIRAAQTVCSKSVRAQFSGKTTAAFLSATTQLGTNDRSPVPANTGALPHVSAMPVTSGKGCDSVSAERLPCEISRILCEQFRLCRMIVNHDLDLHEGSVVVRAGAARERHAGSLIVSEEGVQ